MVKMVRSINQITECIIGCVFRVHQELGPGFRENIYKRALLIELRRENLSYELEMPVTIFYQKQDIGFQRIDLVVGGSVVVELKARDALGQAQYAQVKSYLAATGIETGLLINFSGDRADVRRVTLSKNAKLAAHSDCPEIQTPS